MGNEVSSQQVQPSQMRKMFGVEFIDRAIRLRCQRETIVTSFARDSTDFFLLEW